MVRDDFSRWAPFECDVTLRGYRSWFWHPYDQPKSLDELVDIYFTTVGRGCTMYLAVGPDTRGLIADDDVVRLREWRAALYDIFNEDLARGAAVTASAVRDDAAGWSAGAAVDGDSDTFWSTDERTGWVEIDLGQAKMVNILELAEPIRYGQRIGAFRLDARIGDDWQEVARATTVGYKRLLRFEPVVARRWRVVVEDGRAAPALSQIGLYDASEWNARWDARP